MDNFNEYIDFRGMFQALYLKHENELEQHRYEADYYNRLINFFSEINSYELLGEECELNDGNISFVFGRDEEKSNESTNHVAVSSFYIMFDRILNEFTICEHEQG